MITIQSIQLGRVTTEGDADTRDITTRRWTTAFYKLPIDGPVLVTQTGLSGDEVADKKNHGGPDKAILCYAASHYVDWLAEFPELKMSAGALGENLTISGTDEWGVCIGDRFAIGTAEVEISQPRQPCWKIARRWGVKTLTKRVVQSGRTGWYMRVQRGGELNMGDFMKLIARPHPTWTIARANDVMFGLEKNALAAEELSRLPELSNQWKADLPVG